MQNLDEITPPYLTFQKLKRPPFFLFFEIETWFFVCNRILGSYLGVQKELGKKLFFPRNPRGGIYAPPPRKISWI